MQKQRRKQASGETALVKSSFDSFDQREDATKVAGHNKASLKKTQHQEISATSSRHEFCTSFLPETKMKNDRNILLVGHRYRHAWKRLLSLVFLMGSCLHGFSTTQRLSLFGRCFLASISLCLQTELHLTLSTGFTFAVKSSVS